MGMPGQPQGVGGGLPSQTGVVKSVQRGVSGGAGTITINRVDMTKTLVLSVSKGSAGAVATTSSVTLTPSGGSIVATGNAVSTNNGAGSYPSYTGALSGGTTALTASVYSAKIISPTQISCDGPVEWQVVEHF